MTVLVENGNRVKISGTVSYQGEGNQRQADFSSVEITGAPLNDEYLRKIAFKDDLNRLYEEYKTLHKYFGTGENDVMKRLNKIREERK